MKISPTFRKRAVPLGIVLWAGALAAGFIPLWRYTYTDGPAAAAPLTWPAHGPARDTTRPTIVMLVHPECACSVASIGELARVMAATSAAPAIVLFAVSRSDKDAVTTTPLWHDAASIPRVRAVADPGGEMAARFGAYVSGETLLYDAAGRLQFSGGITPARGHAGDNDGESSIVDLLTGAGLAKASTPVFGCLLPRASRP